MKSESFNIIRIAWFSTALVLHNQAHANEPTDLKQFGAVFEDSGKSVTLFDKGNGAALVELSKKELLEEVHLFGGSYSDKGFRSLKALPRLRTLFISNTSLDTAACEAIGQLKQLKTLYLLRAGLGNTSLAALGKYSTPIRRLFVSYNSIDVSDDYTDDIRRLKQLSTLNLECRLMQCGEISRLVTLRRLRFLYVARCLLTSQSWREIGALNQVWTLSARGVQLTDADVRILKGMKALSSLRVSDGDLTNEHLLEIAQATRIKRVTAYRTAVTAEGVNAARKLRPQLRVEHGPAVPGYALVRKLDYRIRDAVRTLKSRDFGAFAASFTVPDELRHFLKTNGRLAPYTIVARRSEQLIKSLEAIAYGGIAEPVKNRVTLGQVEFQRVRGSWRIRGLFK